MAVTASDIEAALRTALAPLALDVVDDSHLHAGHAGAALGSHFTVRSTSAHLSGLTRVGRHRLIYDALTELMPRGIHALAIEARAPDDS